MAKKRDKKVVCFGDSHTVESWGGRWVKKFQKRVNEEIEKKGEDDQYKCVKCCGDGFQCFNNLRDAEKVIGENEPEYIVIMIGTNDVLDFLWREQKNEWMVKIHADQTKIDPAYVSNIESYSADYAALVKQAAESGAKKVICVSLSPLGEDLNSFANETVNAYCATIEEIAQNQNDKTGNVLFADFNDKLKKHILSNPKRKSKNKKAFSGETSGKVLTLNMIGAKTQNKCCFQSYDKIARRNNNLVLSKDDIHLTETAAALLVDSLIQTLFNAE